MPPDGQFVYYTKLLFLYLIVEEVGQIQESVDLLNRKLNEAEHSHQDLLMNKSRLEHDLKIKSNSLFIDR